ncbi:MAG TPA: adenylate/guanylate cyclase domain-containing protein [Candidatus Limnocylindria bacterium]|nr:adenylate/guanylate cyclase domain-containing protein [Candidatus Limnocylindria bacterium]
MKWKASSLVPVFICASVTAMVCLIEWLGETQPRFNSVNRLEWITFDWRIREAARHSPPVAPNLGFVAMSDESITALLDGSLPYRFGLLWPRQVYARLIDELSAQGAKAVGFDVLFAELRPDHPPAEIDGEEIPSDVFFAQSLRRGSNVILASESLLFPPELFATNALAVAHISAERDRDGILRRTHAFVDTRVWHPIIKEAATGFGWNLERARIEPGKLMFPRRDTNGADPLPLNAEGRFDVGILEHAMAGNPAQPIIHRFEPPFRQERLWQLGIALAAQELKLDLRQAVIDLEHGRIILPSQGTPSTQRAIPIDREARFYIDWSLGLNDSRLTQGAIEDLLIQHEARRAGRMEDVTNRWNGKLVVVGSVASGNNLSDFGATPLEQHTFLVSDYWNVANSLLMDRFVRPLGLPWRLLIIAVMGVLAGLCTWKMKTLGAVASVLGIAAVYVVLAVWVFNGSRLWLPIVTPVVGSLLATHGCLVTYLVRVERRERRRTKDIFSKIVSPDIVRELLGSEKLLLGGVRREVTVFFADARGFTEMTDANQQRAEALAHTYKFTAPQAEELSNQQSEEILSTVNLYLGLAGDCIKKHNGTLDKYIGDCVMAFWGAPAVNPQHAACCVRAVIDIQRAICELNEKRKEENARREEENIRRAIKGEIPLAPLDILTFGSGINTGVATVGLMGSDAHLVNYTVFGREVNLASRLEGASGRARILIGETTYRHLLRDDPDLAATCRAQPPLELKGFRDPVKSYEVPWRPADLSLVEAGQTQTIVHNKDRREDCY